LTQLEPFGNGHALHLADALTGVSVFGATGSGKTSGPAKHLAYGYWPVTENRCAGVLYPLTPFADGSRQGSDWQQKMIRLQLSSQ
jgi:hypothetical protein